MSESNTAPETFYGFCPIEPVPKGRPRYSSRTGRMHTPAATRKYEDAVRAWMMGKYGRTREPMDGCLYAKYEFVLARPKSIKKNKWFSSTKPDIDNFVKSFQDAFDFKAKNSQGISLGVIANDSRISVLSATKRYAVGDEPTGTRFHIEQAHKEVLLHKGVDARFLDAISPHITLIDMGKNAEIGENGVDVVYVACNGTKNKTLFEKTVRKAFPDAKEVIFCGLKA